MHVAGCVLALQFIDLVSVFLPVQNMMKI